MLRSRRNRKRERGQILVLFELVVIIILVFAALVIDIGFLRNNRQILVNTMDAAALAGGSQLPVDSTNVDKANALINLTIQADYPGLPSSEYSISYRCLIGADASGPLINRDIPAVCDPSHSLGHAPTAADFSGAGLTRVTSCDPRAGDTCNVVVVTGNATTEYYLAPVIGVYQGHTGGVVSAACKGPCGLAPIVPVDLVIILDRTMSMTGSSGGMVKITALQNAAKAVLSVYNPKQQRVALALTGPAKIDKTTGWPVSSGCGFGVADNNNWSPVTTLNASVTSSATTIVVKDPIGLPFPTSTPFDIAVDGERMTVTGVAGATAPFTWTVTRASRVGPPTNQLTTTAASHSSGAYVYGVTPWAANSKNVGMWVPVGLSGTDTDTPAPYPTGTAGTYEVAGVPSTSSWIVPAINCISAASDGTDLSTPIRMAQWYLDHYGRYGVTQGIILETDGHPQYGFDSTHNQAGTNAAHTCQAASDAAAAAKADTSHSPDGIQIFTIGYGVDSSSRCPTRATSSGQNNGTYNAYETSTWSNVSATVLLKNIATDASHYYENPSSAQLTSVFTQAATSLSGGGAHLVQLYPAPIVTGAGGSPTAVTVSGRYFSGATGVYFGGGAASSFTVNSDNSITARAPAGISGSIVDVVVTTPGGISTITAADHYTYP